MLKRVYYRFFLQHIVFSISFIFTFKSIFIYIIYNKNPLLPFHLWLNGLVYTIPNTQKDLLRPLSRSFCKHQFKSKKGLAIFNEGYLFGYRETILLFVFWMVAIKCFLNVFVVNICCANTCHLILQRSGCIVGFVLDGEEDCTHRQPNKQECPCLWT